MYYVDCEVEPGGNRMNYGKVIALYLPQFHCIPENDSWWGKGYTDWVALKNSTPQYEGHIQPKKPLDDYFYDLSNPQTIEWQIELANSYGIYGFGIYHYWFNSNLHLLDKPSEILLENKSLNTNYFFIWDNNSWMRTWTNVNADKPGAEREILAPLEYGTEDDWKIHYEYLKRHFEDSRYIRIDNKPLFGLFNLRTDISTINKMCEYMNSLAIKDGFDGIAFISSENYKGTRLEYSYRYEPFCACTIRDYIKNKLMVINTKHRKKLSIYDYDSMWKKIIRNTNVRRNDKSFYGAFVNYDDTPRRGKTAKIVKNGSPDKFEKYMEQLLRISIKQKKEYIFITAWNEWGEGACLEPDAVDKYSYLEALRNAIKTVQN